MEKRLLSAALKERRAHEEVFSRVLPESLSPIGRIVAELITEFYDKDPEAKSADKASLLARVEARFSNPKQAEAISDYISALEDLSVPNLLSDIREHKRQSVGDAIALALANREEPAKVLELMSQYEDLGHNEQEEQSDHSIFQAYSVENLVRTSFTSDNQIKLLPKELNDRVDGGARPGHHILVYARPEIGKTLFVLNLTAGFLIQGLPVLYIGNEDPASDILLRIVSRLSRMTKAQVLANPKKAEELAKAKGYDKLTVAALAPVSPVG